MSKFKKLVMSMAWSVAASSAFADGSLQGTVIKYGFTNNGTDEVMAVDIDDSVATECAVYLVGYDVAWLTLSSTSPMNQAMVSSLISAHATGATVKIDYTVVTVGADNLCFMDTLVVQ